MNLQEIKSALKNNQRVFWSNTSYEVIKDNIGQYLIKCHLNNTFIGLTWRDNVTMNGDEKDFFIGLRLGGLGDSGTRGLANSHISSEMGLFFFTKISMYQMIQFQKGTR